MRYLLVLLLVISCGQKKEVDPRTIHGVDSEFSSYLDLYLANKGSSLAYDISMGFGEMDRSDGGNPVAQCVTWGKWRQIVVLKGYWNSISESEKINLIFHELGHCDLNREHDEEMVGYKPKSLMYPINMGFDSRDMDYYFNELFEL